MANERLGYPMAVCIHYKPSLWVELHRRRRFGVPEGPVESVSSWGHTPTVTSIVHDVKRQGLRPHQPRSAAWCRNSAANRGGGQTLFVAQTARCAHAAPLVWKEPSREQQRGAGKQRNRSRAHRPPPLLSTR